MFLHSHQIRVRYGETDQMGYLYYGRYAEYYEVGRVEALRSLGVTYRDLEVEHGLMMPVVSLEIRYLRPAFYDDLLTVHTSIREVPDTRISFFVEIKNEAGKLLNSGKVVLCFVDGTTRRPVPVPPFVLEKLNPFLA